ncbi:MAG TPA: Imm10 family immunity protein [Pyrinomonadaceae bacterium]
MQRSTDEDEDVPGIEGVYVEGCDQENSCYGCIEDFVLERRSAEIKFTEGANLLADLEGDEGQENTLTELRITFDIDDAKYRELQANLSGVIFSGCGCFKVVV